MKRLLLTLVLVAGLWLAIATPVLASKVTTPGGTLDIPPVLPTAATQHSPVLDE